MTTIAKSGWGYDFDGRNFARLAIDTPVRLAPTEYAKPQCIIAYRLADNRRMHITKRAIEEVQS